MTGPLCHYFRLDVLEGAPVARMSAAQIPASIVADESLFDVANPTRIKDALAEVALAEVRS
jgi:hypothetical protein